MKRVSLMTLLSIAALALPVAMSPSERAFLEGRARPGRGPSDGRFKELLREAMKMRLERPAKFASTYERRRNEVRDEWRWARNKRKKAAQRLRSAS